MSLFLIVMGYFGILVGWVWIMITAFMDSVPWGVGILLCSPVAFVYGFLKWDDTKFPTILLCAGTAVHILGRILDAI